VPKMRTQRVAARTVAETLADLATGPGCAAAPGSARCKVRCQLSDSWVADVPVEGAGALRARR
jgi:hypothetical protein